MNEASAGITEDLLLLYELSLAIGQALDPQTTSRNFLRILVTRRNLNGALLWWLPIDATSQSPSDLVLLDAIPRAQVGRERLPLTHPGWQATRDGKARSFTAADPEFASLFVDGGRHSAACAVFPLHGQGLLVIHSASPAAVGERVVSQLRAVVDQLATAIQGGMAFTRLQQSEAELREAGRRLAEAQQISESYAAKLGRAHAHLQTLIRTVPDLVWLKDPAGVYLSCNQRFEGLYGVAEKDLIGKTDDDFVDPDVAAFFRTHDRIAMDKGGPSVNEEWLTFADGHRELVETTKTPMYDADRRRLIGVLGIAHDITERHRADAALRASEERSRNLASLLRLLCDNVPDMIWAKDLDKRFLFANQAICRRLLNAADTDEPVGKTDLFFALRERDGHPDDPHWHTFGELCQDSDAITLSRDEPSVFEEYGNVQGRFVFLDVHKAPFRDAQGQVIGTVGSARDITDRKQIESELAQHRQHLEALVQQGTAALLATEARASHILQSSADGLYGVDPQGLITFINPAACTLLGYRAEQLIGASAHALFHHSRPDGTPCRPEDCRSENAIRQGRAVRVDNEVYWRADGHAVPVMYAVHPMLQDGINTGAVISFVDMSEQRAAAAAREQALIVAENLARVRSEFLANMSHEIRTPLNGVLGFAQIGHYHYGDAEKARNAFEKILLSGNRLLGVINDILDFSAIEAGKLKIEQTEVSLRELIEHAVERVRDRAHAKCLALRVDRAPDLPETCIGDPLRLGQVLLNLLANAVKFTADGEIGVSARRVGDQLVFIVTDTGIGMSEEQLEHLFNPFQQADASITRKFGGSGLGLAISKRIVELMGGDILVESSPGVGSRFAFQVPFVETCRPAPRALPEPAAPTANFDRPLAGISILVAEDDAVNRMVLEHYLLENGAQVLTVVNGREAVDCVLHHGGKAWDIVLMDLQMPEMDGYEATRRIREIAPDLPIVSQTAHVLDDDREKCFAAGMAGYLAKPIDAEELVTLVRQLVGTGRAR